MSKTKGPVEPADEEKLLQKYSILKNDQDGEQLFWVIEQRKKIKEELQKQIKDLDEEIKENAIESIEQIDDLKKEKTGLEKKINVHKEDIDSNKKEIEHQKISHLENLDKFKKDFDTSKSEKQSKLDVIEQKNEIMGKFEKEKDMIIGETEEQKRQLDEENTKRDKQKISMEKEKEDATDKLKKHMLHQIQETKTNLFALRKEQLDSKTRLTVLQNHQLTTELEYQSKQTEKQFFKNQKLIEQVKALQRDVEIHKLVESELAKRSHFCQKLIKKLNGKTKEFENQNGEYKTSIENIERNINAKENDKIIKNQRFYEIKEEKSKFDVKMDQYKQELGQIMEENNGLNYDYNADLKRYAYLLQLLESSSSIFKRKLNNQHYDPSKDKSFGKELLKNNYSEQTDEQKAYVLEKIIGIVKTQLEKVVDLDQLENFILNEDEEN